MFCEKLQNVCSVAANPDKMDKIGYDFWTHRLPKLANPLQTSSPQKSCMPVLRHFRSTALRTNVNIRSWIRNLPASR